MISDPHAARFIQRMDALVAAKDDPHVIADETAGLLGELLLPHPEFLEERFRQPDGRHYRQHVVHVHPQGRYSIVSLVWKPGQATPVHDHRCWCVVGVLQGHERESRYHLYSAGAEDFLVRDGDAVYAPGQVCRLVPPDEDIHRVANAGDEGLTISIHVYGADIAALGTSINHVFRHQVRDEVPAGARRISWRAAA
jgi:3-mercaptopropionate dioxygenase